MPLALGDLVKDRRINVAVLRGGHCRGKQRGIWSSGWGKANPRPISSGALAADSCSEEDVGLRISCRCS